MKRNILTLALILALAGPLRAVTLVGVTHIDYYPENGSSTQFCCDGWATYALEYTPGSVEFSHYSILDITNSAVWTASNFTAVLGGLTPVPGGELEIEIIEHAGKDYLQLYGFPGLVTTISPDHGENVWHDFGYSFIELPALSSVTVPEPASLLLLSVCLCGLLIRR